MVSKRSALHGDVHHRSNSVLRQVCPYSVRFMAGLGRSLRLQYAKKSVNNFSTLAGNMYASATILLGQPGPQRRRSHALLRKGRSACLLLTRHSAQLRRSPVVNNNSEECKSHSGHVQVHAETVPTMVSPWHIHDFMRGHTLERLRT